nr:MAG TPA: hypothetical protein [Caudoviricetes sp.]
MRFDTASTSNQNINQSGNYNYRLGVHLWLRVRGAQNLCKYLQNGSV